MIKHIINITIPAKPLPPGKLKPAGFLLTSVMKYAKPPLSVTDQIKLLETRGLVIGDKAKAEIYLSNISYYRLSAYMLPLKIKGSEDFEPNTSFEDVLNLYLFDREFRILVFDAIERLEIAFRTQIIYQPSMNGGAFWFEDDFNFSDKSRKSDHLVKLDGEVGRSSEVFIKHFHNKYSSENRPPAWMTFEVTSLGLLSKIYRNIKPSLQAKKKISEHFGISPTEVFESWLQSVTYVRNICAHHSRLWNRILTDQTENAAPLAKFMAFRRAAEQ